ncbi:hypothetical protein [Trichloromonas sp.]|uniref:hypothetical protein n=1 Tax=Trichloromonas sp. TaxID=3069249 RepID=UPI003D8198C5
MKSYLATLVLFLLAFAGLATGLILRRKGLRGGCGSSAATDCTCRGKTAATKGAETGAQGHIRQGDNRENGDSP